MKIERQAVLDELTAKQRFLNQHARITAPVNQSPVRAALDELLRAVEAQEAAHRTAKLRWSSRRARLNERRTTLLMAHLRPIVHFAQKRADKAPMLACLRVPSRSLADDDLITDTTAISELVVPHRAVFMNEGFPADFLEQLAAACEAVRTAAAEYDACRRERDDAVAAIGRLVSRGRAIARVLHALVRERLDGNARLIAEWRATMTF